MSFVAVTALPREVSCLLWPAGACYTGSCYGKFPASCSLPVFARQAAGTGSFLLHAACLCFLHRQQYNRRLSQGHNVMYIHLSVLEYS